MNFASTQPPVTLSDIDLVLELHHHDQAVARLLDRADLDLAGFTELDAHCRRFRDLDTERRARVQQLQGAALGA